MQYPVSRSLGISTLAFAVLTLVHAVPAAGAPASDIRFGRVQSTNFQGGLTTVPLFAVPAGSRLVITDITWTLGSDFSAPQTTLTDPVAVWLQDTSNNVRWYEGLVANSATPHVGLTTGIVFQPGELATLGVSKPFTTPISWSASWSGYVEAVGLSAVEGTPEQLGFDAFPNPSGSRVVLQFRLARDGRAALSIYDAHGRKIRSLGEQGRAAGWNAVEWDGRDDRGRAVRGGTYFARLDAAEGHRTEKLIHLGGR